jgi:hypothetical protein
VTASGSPVGTKEAAIILLISRRLEEAFPDDHPSGEHKTGSGEHMPGPDDEDDGITALPDPMSVDVLLKRFGIK